MVITSGPINADLQHRAKIIDILQHLKNVPTLTQKKLLKPFKGCSWHSYLMTAVIESNYQIQLKSEVMET